jgi:hypothetical protein
MGAGSMSWQGGKEDLAEVLRGGLEADAFAPMDCSQVTGGDSFGLQEVVSTLGIREPREEEGESGQAGAAHRGNLPIVPAAATCWDPGLPYAALGNACSRPARQRLSAEPR